MTYGAFGSGVVLVLCTFRYRRGTRARRERWVRSQEAAAGHCGALQASRAASAEGRISCIAVFPSVFGPLSAVCCPPAWPALPACAVVPGCLHELRLAAIHPSPRNTQNARAPANARTHSRTHPQFRTPATPPSTECRVGQRRVSRLAQDRIGQDHHRTPTRPLLHHTTRCYSNHHSYHHHPPHPSGAACSKLPHTPRRSGLYVNGHCHPSPPPPPPPHAFPPLLLCRFLFLHPSLSPSG
ncbi:hypothetical protein DFH27DRAFT_180569 [Peziza echinospora]|nr:hypothetical protein DFH27DRAFT_180569 [Peziza echinospora]